MRQSATDVLVLVHPIWHDRQRILPCTYGYATTIRRAQGATYVHGCLYFDHSYPPEPGYGYVATSRFKSKAGVYLYGKIRRTDFIPVHAKRDRANYDQIRSEESCDDYDSEHEDDIATGPFYEEAELSSGYGSDTSDSMCYSDQELSLIHI